MPALYEQIKKSVKASGKTDRESKRIAAATYNQNRGNAPPVTKTSYTGYRS